MPRVYHDEMMNRGRGLSYVKNVNTIHGQDGIHIYIHTCHIYGAATPSNQMVDTGGAPTSTLHDQLMIPQVEQKSAPLPATRYVYFALYARETI